MTSCYYSEATVNLALMFILFIYVFVMVVLCEVKKILSQVSPTYKIFIRNVCMRFGAKKQYLWVNL